MLPTRKDHRYAVQSVPDPVDVELGQSDNGCRNGQRIPLSKLLRLQFPTVEGVNAHPGPEPTVEEFPENYEHVTAVYDTALRQFEEQNERAYATILLTINDGPLVHVQNLTNAKEIWEKLGELYGVKGYTARHLILKSLVTTTV